MAVVAVLGAGTMGRGIAHVAAQSGHDVRLRDVDLAIVEAARKAVRENLQKGVKAGKVDSSTVEPTLARIRAHTDVQAAVKDADWVIEAIPEKLELKQALVREVEASVPGGCVIATNTSSLSITKIGEAAADPGRVIGLHFFNPPHLLKLIEVVRGERTSAATVERSLAFAKGLGKEPILVRDSPGFASSRLGLVLGLEAIRMLEGGVASAEDIDKAMELGYNHPMGPLKLTDLVGLDVRLAIAEHLHRELGTDAFRPPDLLRAMVKEGRLGRKAGRGFYSYP